MQLLSFLSVATLAGQSVLALPQTGNNPCDAFATDQLEFDVTIEVFQAQRNNNNPNCFDWSSDNCSTSPDNPDGYEFTPFCQRHDFGYRNSKAQGRCDEAYRERVDNKFKDGLYGYCAQFSGLESWKGVECRRIADIYHAFVRGLGSCD